MLNDPALNSPRKTAQNGESNPLMDALHDIDLYSTGAEEPKWAYKDLLISRP